MEGGSGSAEMEMEKSETAAVRPVGTETPGKAEEMKEDGGEETAAVVELKVEEQTEPKEADNAEDVAKGDGEEKHDGDLNANKNEEEGIGLKLMAQYKVACLNCGVQLYIELPPNCASFQCCQCHAVHKILQPDPSLAASDSKKRKRKEKREKKEDKEPRELSGYNKFMRTQLNALKETNPELGHKEAFKLATEKWATSPDNPKNAAQQGDESGKKPSESAEGRENEDEDKEKEEEEKEEEAAESQEACAAAAEDGDAAVKPEEVVAECS